MTLLELVNLARSEAGVANSDLATVQSGLAQDSQRFVNWVKREWLRLQAEQEQWQFLRVTGDFLTTAAQAVYTPTQAEATSDGTNTGTPILADWIRDSFRISSQGSYNDEQVLVYIPWRQYRDLYLYGSTRTQQSKPVSFSQDPSKNVYLGNVPDAIYRVNYEFYRTPQALSADADEPLMPARFHDLLVYRVVRASGIFFSAPEVIGRADSVIGPMSTALANDQLPDLEAPPPLA